MRIKIFYIVTAILILGLSIGAWRSHQDSRLNAYAPPGQTKTPILMISTKGSWNWVLGQCFKYNFSQSTYNVKLQYVESRDAMKQIMSGSVRPVIWSTDNPAIVGRINDLWTQAHGKSLVNTSDPVTSRVYFSSPLVFLTTKKNLTYLAPLLNSPTCWDQLSQIGAGTQAPPAGKLTFGMANPETTSSAMLTLALILDSYCAEHHLSPDSIQVVQSRGFVDHLTSIERLCERKLSLQPESEDLTSQYVAHTKIADFIVTQESEAIKAASANKNLVVVYPSPTLSVRQGISLVEGPWVSDDQKAGASQVLAAFASSKSIHDGVVNCMRPEDLASPESLDPVLDKLSGQGFKETFSESTAPNYKAINEVIYVWKTHIPAE